MQKLLCSHWYKGDASLTLHSLQLLCKTEAPSFGCTLESPESFLNSQFPSHTLPSIGYHNKIYWVVLTTEIYLIIVLEAGSPRSGCQHDQILARALTLACRVSHVVEREYWCLLF